MSQTVKFPQNKAFINHRGEFCVFHKNTFCQEGICTGCEIYLRLFGKRNGKV